MTGERKRALGESDGDWEVGVGREGGGVILELMIVVGLSLFESGLVRVVPHRRNAHSAHWFPRG